MTSSSVKPPIKSDDACFPDFKAGRGPEELGAGELEDFEYTGFTLDCQLEFSAPVGLGLVLVNLRFFVAATTVDLIGTVTSVISD